MQENNFREYYGASVDPMLPLQENGAMNSLKKTSRVSFRNCNIF